MVGWCVALLVQWGWLAFVSYCNAIWFMWYRFPQFDGDGKSFPWHINDIELSLPDVSDNSSSNPSAGPVSSLLCSSSLGWSLCWSRIGLFFVENLARIAACLSFFNLQCSMCKLTACTYESEGYIDILKQQVDKLIIIHLLKKVRAMNVWSHCYSQLIGYLAVRRD